MGIIFHFHKPCEHESLGICHFFLLYLQTKGKYGISYCFVNGTVLYTIHQESEQIGVHTMRNILFIPEIPKIESYLVSVLNDFFKTQRLVVTEIEKMKVKEEQL